MSMPMLASPHLHPAISPFGGGGGGASMDPYAPPQPHHYHHPHQPLLPQHTAPPPQHNIFGNPLPPTTTSTSPPLPLASPDPLSTSLSRTEHPSFSLLPPLKSLSVLDIDELAYLDEMSVAIARSAASLRELRVGLARHAVLRKWARPHSLGRGLVQIDRTYPTLSSVRVGEKRLGGVLGVLVGLIWNLRSPRRPTMRTTAAGGGGGGGQKQVQKGKKDGGIDGAEVGSKRDTDDGSSSGSPDSAAAAAASKDGTPSSTTTSPAAEDPLHRTLRLEVLELERVPLAVPVLLAAFDWTRLTSLTLLNCSGHEQLWKTLRRAFAPTPHSPAAYASPRPRSSVSPRKSRSSIAAADEANPDDLLYPLRLKKLHTNTVTPALIAFLRETLAPNSLTELYLQDSSRPSSSGSASTDVSLAAIFRGPLRRHRGSLEKLLIDSSTEPREAAGDDDQQWRKWMLKREVLAFVCGGKMPRLRELGAALEYRDWVSLFFSFLFFSLPSLRLVHLY